MYTEFCLYCRKSVNRAEADKCQRHPCHGRAQHRVSQVTEDDTATSTPVIIDFPNFANYVTISPDSEPEKFTPGGGSFDGGGASGSWESSSSSSSDSSSDSSSSDSGSSSDD